MNEYIAYQQHYRLDNLRRKKLVYLATPYSKHPGGLEYAFVAACRLAGYLVHERVTVYSPIAHTHPIAEHARIDKTDKLWYTFNHNIMDACDAMVIGLMADWDTSRGVIYERGYFSGQSKPILYLDTDDYTLYANVSELPRATEL